MTCVDSSSAKWGQLNLRLGSFGLWSGVILMVLVSLSSSRVWAQEDGDSEASASSSSTTTTTSTTSGGEDELPVFQFSEQELPKEAVMPKLDTPRAVLNRKHSYSRRFQADLGAGWLLDEAFYNNLFTQVQSSYHWSEESGIGARYLVFGSGLTEYGKQFESSVSYGPPEFSRAAGPSQGWSLFYERRSMYGKMSFSKRNVKTSYIGWDAYAGMIKYGSRQLPFLGASLINRFYFNNSWALNLNVRGGVRQAVDPLSLDGLRTSSARPSEGDFKTTTKVSLMLDFGINYLF